MNTPDEEHEKHFRQRMDKDLQNTIIKYVELNPNFKKETNWEIERLSLEQMIERYSHALTESQLEKLKKFTSNKYGKE